ncbi:DUF4269 domain-containing protein [Litoribacter alkaliphilus]|uniref:DUF4269 domain-containing protein n=1 Tax=Litoribacter ruber TaxID=702568 RepID=A0AAP2CGQ1_9BACT|nr:DUF4269 domain-containing protein [Litoribacter alkaliphilus]MBS9523244.1 DUF4269 domain-containing protein [Litoribacter alkaliphilus]
MYPFTTIDYLEHGNQRQKQVFELLTKYQLMAKLEKYHPLVVGTIPLGIDVPQSDVDIICEIKDPDDFRKDLQSKFGGEKWFSIKKTDLHNKPTIVCRFELEGLPIEVFGQDMPTEKQLAFRHMIIEYHILKKFDDDFKEKIIELKREGMKTEPAFTKLLGLEGNPYLVLLDYPLEKREDEFDF